MNAEIINALVLARDTIQAALDAKGYKYGECVDAWTPITALEVKRLAYINRVLKKTNN